MVWWVVGDLEKHRDDERRVDRRAKDVEVGREAGAALPDPDRGARVRADPVEAGAGDVVDERALDRGLGLYRVK